MVGLRDLFRSSGSEDDLPLLRRDPLSRIADDEGGEA